MSANMSQEEINAMLGLSGGDTEPAAAAPEEPTNGTPGEQANAAPPDVEGFMNNSTPKPEQDDAPTHDVNDFLTPDEVDLLGEVGNICMGAVATTMYTLLDHRVSITTPRVNVYSTAEVLRSYRTPFVIVDVQYVEGIEGKNLLLLKEHDAMLITDLLMGGDGHVEEGSELNEMHMSAISEIMNQMIGASATAMSQLLGRIINISTPHSEWMEAESDVSDRLDASELVIKISFDMEIEGLLKSQLLQLMPYQLGRDLAQKLMETQSQDTAALEAKSAPAPAPAPTAAPAPAPMPAPAPAAAAAPPKLVDVRPANYPAFDTAPPSGVLGGKSLDLVADIPLQVSVELGKTKKTINEILEFGLGTIVVLDRIAGEHVDVLVNGKLIASGEVVVIDENYGVRITDIYD